MKYIGGCHCGEVRFEVEMEIKELLSCNCSICTKRGHLLAFTSDNNFRLLSGENSTVDYQFGKKSIHHYFCKVCGIAAFGKGFMPDGTPMRSVNVRCLEDIDIDQFPIYRFDGKSL